MQREKPLFLERLLLPPGEYATVFRWGDMNSNASKIEAEDTQERSRTVWEAAIQQPAQFSYCHRLWQAHGCHVF